MKRLELTRIRVCSRCGRGAAELRAGGGENLTVPLDAVRARHLSDAEGPDDLRSLTDLTLETFAASGLTVSEIVLDVSEGRLRGLVSLVRDDEPDVVGCTAEEGVALAIRGKTRLYATDEALAQGIARSAKPKPESGPDTIH